MLKRNGMISALCFIGFLAAEAPHISVAEALVLVSILFFVPGILPFVFRQSQLRAAQSLESGLMKCYPAAAFCGTGSCDRHRRVRADLVDIHSFYCAVCGPSPLGNKDT